MQNLFTHITFTFNGLRLYCTYLFYVFFIYYSYSRAAKPGSKLKHELGFTSNSYYFLYDRNPYIFYTTIRYKSKAFLSLKVIKSSKVFFQWIKINLSKGSKIKMKNQNDKSANPPNYVLSINILIINLHSG